ncbi:MULTISPECIES: cysteine synthase A [Cytobacillus]|jgi:cysteine synthase|uniref:Cysteine synthase n=3 Tax=Cytobacillus TaxID=2675230 RepID=A0A160M5Q1_9BACI|nr:MULTISPECIES: cysteine synthase A [Cytobacillus]EFV74113.1 cysteine synthase [Bacillus sp. 2_A_57_CT2]AND37716.1 cysteine synthase A [Cytobacillus oceanisediminis 2691]MBU8733117.1 cysteine synthase A [Cytobacillus oceanisediminis]MBY0159409.1 cysteine synthase A [Cytobacillus firmus]MCM3246420.1 cysteine synthase A [Cytobacillus oceanisediminis]
MVRVANSIADLVGQTPIVKLNRLVDDNSADVYLKLEYMNPGSSVKDRIALAMITAAEKDGSLKPGDTIIEPTSGNTGIGLAMIAAAKGYKAVLVMPETMSMERRNLLRAYGADLVLTPGPEGMGGAIRKAQELAKENGYFVPQQFENPANPEIHRLTTGPEITEQMGDQLDAFISGIGTGGTITGAGQVLKEKYKNIKIYAVEPTDSPVLSGGKPGPHKIQGIGAGFVPDTLDTKIYDEVIQITNDEAFEYARRAAKEEGILGGISSGAAISAALKVAKELGKGKKVLAIIPSNGERYLSTPLYQFEAE